MTPASAALAACPLSAAPAYAWTGAGSRTVVLAAACLALSAAVVMVGLLALRRNRRHAGEPFPRHNGPSVLILLTMGAAVGLCLALLAGGRTAGAPRQEGPADGREALAQGGEAERDARERFMKSHETDFRPAEPFHLFGADDFPDIARRKYKLGRETRSCFVLQDQRVVETEITPQEGQRLLCRVAADFPPSADPHAAVTFSLRALGRDGRERLLVAREWTAAAFPARWEPVVVDLGGYAGRRATLRFEGGPVGGADAPGGSGGCLVSDPRLRGPAASAGPSVLFVSIETLRRDHMSFYGYPRKTTPFLEELARDAVVFDEAYSQSSWTRPSVATMLTGLYPSQHGARLTLDRLSGDLVLLPELLREQGYVTAGFCTNELLRHQVFNYDQGFDLFVDEEERPIAEMKDDVLRWLDEAKPKAFFIFMHAYDPHAPYRAPDHLEDAFDTEYRGPLAELEPLNEDGLQHAGPVSQRDVEYVMARYDAEVLYTDRSLQELAAGLKARGLWDGTLLVITSDHGEEFYEHGDWGHARNLYPEKLAVPLLIKLPGQAHGGARVTGVASAVDIMPTVLSALGVEGPGYLPGMDLLAALKAGNRTGRKYHLAEYWAERCVDLASAEYHVVTVYGSVIAEGRQYILQSEEGGGSSECLFELGGDPAGRDNLVQRQPELAKRFARLLEEARREVAARGDGTIPGSGQEERVTPDTETLARLKALGYM